MFGGQLILGTLVIAISVVFHVSALIGLASWLEKQKTSTGRVHDLVVLLGAVFYIIAIHTLEAWGWAALFYYLGEFSDFTRALYFSVVTSTTLGYGDIILSERWQLLGTFEAMGGLILFGTSTAFFIEVMRRLFDDIKKRQLER